MLLKAAPSGATSTVEPKVAPPLKRPATYTSPAASTAMLVGVALDGRVHTDLSVRGPPESQPLPLLPSVPLPLELPPEELPEPPLEEAPELPPDELEPKQFGP